MLHAATAAAAPQDKDGGQAAKLQLQLTLAPYLACLVYTVYVSRRRASYDKAATAVPANERDRVSSFPQQVSGAIMFRVVWIVAVVSDWFRKAGEDSCHDPHAFVSLCSRLAQLLFFSAFGGVLVTWWDVIRAEDRGAVRVSQDLLRTLRRSSTHFPLDGAFLSMPSLWSTLCSSSTIYVLGNFWVFAVVLALVAVEFYVCDAALGRRIDDAETVVVAVFYLGLAAGFAVSWRKLRGLLVAREDLERPVRVVAAVCAVLFCARSLLFLSRPLLHYSFQGTAQQVLYPSFFFTVPELVPSVVVLYLMTPRAASKPLEARPLLASSSAATAEGQQQVLTF
jgi:hypothetical protein